VIELSVAVGKCPCLFLIQPHQRCFNDEILIHGEICRNVHGFDENIPAIRITAKVHLAHACNDCFCICLISQSGSECHEQHTPCQNECVWHLHIITAYFHIMTAQGVRTQLSEQ